MGSKHHQLYGDRALYHTVTQYLRERNEIYWYLSKQINIIRSFQY